MKKQQLPIELGMRAALKIYASRLRIFAYAVLFSLGVGVIGVVAAHLFR